METVQICLTVAAGSMSELRANRDSSHGADLVELRLDTVRDLDVDGALSGRTCPVIVTCRPTWEGGHFEGSEEERHAILRRALDLGAEWVDLEWKGEFDELIAERRGRNIVLSMHDFKETPVDLEDRYRAMRRCGAQVVKIAVTSNSGSDVVRLLRLGRATGSEKVVVVGMGQIGSPTRLLPILFGSSWTYAGESAAPGQLPLRTMVEEFRCREVTKATKVYGVAGAPISHSLSPAMHNRGFRFFGRDAVYVPFEAVGVEDLMGLVQELGVVGLSVTAPFKQPILPYLSHVDTIGEGVGAVNTLKVVGDCWNGINTDVPGFLAPLEARGGVRGLRASVLGAGGSSRAVAFGLARGGADVTICARQESRAEAVASLVGGRVGCLPPEPASWDLLVNTTPVGTYPNVEESPVDAGSLVGGKTVYDLVYNPRRTRLIREAIDAGCEVVCGLEMLVAQALRQFEWWCGVPPSVELFREAALEALASRSAGSQEP